MDFNRRHVIIADSSHPVTIRTLNLLKWKVRKCKKGSGSIVSGIDKIKSYAKLNIVYCKEWNYEQYSYIWDKSKKFEKLDNQPVDDNNHLWDALRYGVQGLGIR
jgi:phage terminase large subunit